MEKAIPPFVFCTFFLGVMSWVGTCLKYSCGEVFLQTIGIETSAYQRDPFMSGLSVGGISAPNSMYTLYLIMNGLVLQKLR